MPGSRGGMRSVGFMLDRLALMPLPTLQGERVILRGPRDSAVDDWLRHPIDPEEEDGYGSSWRREWDGRRDHTREHLIAARCPVEPGSYTWAVEYDGHCIGSAGLRVDPDQHCAQVGRAPVGRTGLHPGQRAGASPTSAPLGGASSSCCLLHDRLRNLIRVIFVRAVRAAPPRGFGTTSRVIGFQHYDLDDSVEGDSQPRVRLTDRGGGVGGEQAETPLIRRREH